MIAKKLIILSFIASFVLSGCNAIATIETQIPT